MEQCPVCLFVGICSVKWMGRDKAGRKTFLETKVSVLIMLDSALISYHYLEKNQKVTVMNC